MPDLKQTLTDEIRRLSRKEIKTVVTPLLETIAALKKQLSEMKKSAAELTKRFEKAAPAAKEPVIKATAEGTTVRISAQGIKKLREKKKITQAQLAAMLGVTLHTVSMWEMGRSVPRKEMKAKLCAIRKMGKRELAAALSAAAAPAKAAKAAEAPAAAK